MSIHRSSDSMSRCGDQYDNMFQISKRPDLKAPSAIKDTMEVSKAAEIKKDALERLTSPKYHLLQQGFLKAGKILFLTVALPPYLLIWGLPKFLITEGLPAVVILLDWVTAKIKQKAQRPLQFIIDRNSQMLAFIRLTAQRLIRPVVQFTIDIRQFFQSMRDRIAARANQWLERVKNTLRKPSKFISGVTVGIQNRISQIKGRAAKQMQRLTEKFQEGLERIMNSPQALVAWGTLQLQKLNDYRLTFAQKAASKFKQSSHAATVCQNWINAQCNLCKKLVQLAISPIVRLYQEGIKPSILAVVNVLKNGWNRTGEFVKDRRQKTVQFLEKIRNGVKVFNAQQFLDWIVLNSKMKGVPEFLRKIFLQISQNRFYKGLFAVGYWIVTSVVYYATTAVKAFIEFVAKIYETIAKGCRALLSAVKNGAAVIYNYIGVGFGWLAQLGHKGVYALLLVVIMGGILIQWGFELLSELSSKAVSRLSFSKSP